MVRKIAPMILIGMLMLVGLTPGCQKGGKEQKADEGPFTGDPTTVVGKVGDAEIQLKEVTERYESMKKNPMPASAGLSERQLQRKALDDIIDRKLLYVAAQKAGLTPPAEQVDQELQGFKARFPSAEQFLGWLGQQGLTEETAREQFSIDLAIQNYLKEKLPDTARVGPEQARAYYDQHPERFQTGERVHARHILVKVATGAGEEEKAQAQRKAQRLLGRVRGGADFASLARDSSDCPSAARGGDLGEFGRGQMVPPFEEAAFKLDSAQVSDVVETQFGYHIIRSEGHVPARLVPYDPRVEDWAGRQVRIEHRNDLVKKLIDELRAGAKIQRKI